MNKKLNYFSAIIFLSKYIKDFRKHFVMFYFGWLVDSILTILMPILFGIMIDEIVYYQNLGLFMKIAAVFLVCIVFSGVLYFLLYAQHGYLMNMFVFTIRKDVFSHFQKSDAGYLTNVSTGEILALLQKYSQECMHFVIRNIIHTVNGMLLVVLYSVYLFVIDWRIGMIALGSALFSVIINTKFKGKIRRLGDEERGYYGKYIGWMYEIINGLRDIRILGAKEKVEEKFEENHKKLFSVGVKNGITSLTAENFLSLLGLVIRLMIYSVSAYLTVHGNVTLGTLTVIFSFYEKLSENIGGVSARYLDAQNRISYIQKIYDFLQMPTEQGGTRTLNVTKGEILFNNVAFGYENQGPVLKNISLKITPGDHVALVGESGCGKTTLAHLLIGFYQPQGGTIEVDGQKLSDCKLESIRNEFGFVQQDVLVFDGTIRQNIQMGNIHAKEAQILEACKDAGLKAYIDSLPNGLDTVIGSQGVDLSGGQKQRIAIARIFLKNPKIVIFDEATSALDRDTEETIHEVWKHALKDKTAIMIAHRLSTVMLCEKVVVLEDGHIAEIGEPSVLIGSSQRFRRLFALKEEG